MYAIRSYYDLEKIVENRNMQDYILDIVVPMEEQIEIKDGKKKAILKKVFPGYVLVKIRITSYNVCYTKLLRRRLIKKCN